MKERNHHGKHAQCPAASQDSLLALFFGVGRLLKSGWAQDEKLLPSFLHLETLRFIEEDNEPTMTAIAQYLKVAAPTATSLVNSLVKEGVLERRTDEGDRRRVRLALTRAGRQILDRTRREREKVFERVIAAPLSSAERAQLARILSTIITNHRP